MATISIEIDDDVLEQAQQYAAARESSVPALLQNYLSGFATNAVDTADIVRELRSLQAESRAEVGPITWTREELYDRG